MKSMNIRLKLKMQEECNIIQIFVMYGMYSIQVISFLAKTISN